MSERMWQAIGSHWLGASLGEVTAQRALDEVLGVARAELRVTLEVVGPEAETAEPARYRLHGGGGEAIGSLVVVGDLAPRDGERLAKVIASLLDLPCRVSLSRTVSHDIANKLGSLLVNAELVEFLTQTGADDPPTLLEAARTCVAVTQELIQVVATLQVQRDGH